VETEAFQEKNFQVKQFLNSLSKSFQQFESKIAAKNHLLLQDGFGSRHNLRVVLHELGGYLNDEERKRIEAHILAAVMRQ
jgi:hypothetical protein